MYIFNFDVITSNISSYGGPTHRNVMSPQDRRKEKKCAAHLVRAARQLGTALPVRASRRQTRGNGRGGGSDVTSLWQLPDGK